MTAPIGYELGAALGSIATLPSLLIPDPESEFIDYGASEKLADGTLRALGFPQASWHYGYLTAKQYDALKAFVTLANAVVCIATMNNDRDFVRYDCMMVLPEKFVIRDTRYVDITITFNRLVEAE